MAANRQSSKYSGAEGAIDPAWRVVIEPGPSARLAAWVTAACAAALVATLAADLPAPVQAVVAAGVIAAAIRAARRQAWQEGKGAVRRFAVDLSGRVEAELADGRRVDGRLAGESFVAPWLAIVRWRPDGARFPRTLAIAPDAVDGADFRRLRILLRWR